MSDVDSPRSLTSKSRMGAPTVLGSPRSVERSVTSPRRYVDDVLSARQPALPKIPRTCIISHSERLLKQFTTAHPHTAVDIGWAAPVHLYFVDAVAGGRFSIVRGNAGAPMAAVLLEELIALGFRRFVALGPAGHPTNGNSPKVPIGGLVLVQEAYIHEGTSPHYHPPSSISYPTPKSVEALSQLLAAQGLDYQTGAVASTDALYRETPSFIAEVMKKQVLAIDMELSALFTVAAFHGVEIAGLLYVSDIVDQSGHWHVGTGDDRLKQVGQRLLPLLTRYARQDDTP